MVLGSRGAPPFLARPAVPEGQWQPVVLAPGHQLLRKRQVLVHDAGRPKVTDWGQGI